jgi:hypothetical protein
VVAIPQDPRTSERQPGTSDLGHWKRESLAYQSGLLDDLPGELAAPR